MKKLKLAATLTGLLLAAPAWSYTINSGVIDVGSKDTLVAQTTLATSSVADETNWVNSVLGSATYEYKIEAVDTNWVLVDGETEIFAQALTLDPAYYIIKIGTGGVTGDSHYLYDNLTSTDFAVIALSDWGLTAKNANQINIARVSHITAFNGDNGGGGNPDCLANPTAPGCDTKVPEPESLALLGLGLLSLVAVRRRKA